MEDFSGLMEAAVRARKSAYAPYSHFAVGAALLTAKGRVYTGCNVESAAYAPTCCAERVAFFKAVSEGEREFAALAVAGGPEGEPPRECPPCGVCRQVMAEFCDPASFRVVLLSGGERKTVTLGELLPFGFGPGSLREEGGTRRENV